MALCLLLLLLLAALASGNAPARQGLHVAVAINRSAPVADVAEAVARQTGLLDRDVRRWVADGAKTVSVMLRTTAEFEDAIRVAEWVGYEHRWERGVVLLLGPAPWWFFDNLFAMADDPDE